MESGFWCFKKRMQTVILGKLHADSHGPMVLCVLLDESLDSGRIELKLKSSC